MKTSLKFLSLFATVSVPAALAAEFAGIGLPPGVNAGNAFCVFVIALVSLTVVSDYSHRRLAMVAAATSCTPKAAHALAA